MSNNWQNNFQHVKPGEPVNAGVVSRPDRALQDRTEYLRARLDASALGQALFDVNATVAPDVLAGEPVYWNATTQRYERALAAVEPSATTQALVTSPSSDVMGLCFKKTSATLADIVLRGIVQLPEISNAVDGTVTAGRYYLSADQSGKLVKEKPPVSISVCYVQGAKDSCSDVPWVVVMPQVRDFIEDHVHYRFDLVARPAGSHDPVDAASAGTHTITSADVELEGWLPAAHSSFAGKAPTGAKFGYNLAQHIALSRVWPPLPVQAVALLWDKGVDRVGATEIPLGPDGLCVVNKDGIWWMSDCYGEVPWPPTLDTAAEASSVAVGPDCPLPETMRVVLVFLRMVFGNDRSVVTSLKPAVNSPITVANCDGLPANSDNAMTGDLELGLNLQFLTDPTEAIGGQAFKTITEEFKFQKGWVAEGVRVGAGPLTITGTRTRVLTAAEKTALGLPSSDASTIKQGIITVSYDDQLVEREISPQIIRLADTVERIYQDIPYLGFPEDQNASVRVRLNVPASNLGAALQMKVRVQLFGRGGTSVTPATLPALTMTYRRLSRPATGGTVLPAADTSITFNAAVAVTIDTAIEVESQAFTVEEGDTVLVTLSRAGSSDSYAAEVGVLRMTGIVFVP
jgi:hypothetical protein